LRRWDVYLLWSLFQSKATKIHVLLALLAGQDVPSIVINADENDLYFTDRTEKTVNVLNLNTRIKKTLIRTVTSAPVGLAVDVVAR